MTTKKTSGANLEKAKGIFLKIGLSIAMLAVLFAFEYKVFERIIPEISQGLVFTPDDEMIQITVPKPPPPPPPDRKDFVPVPDDTEIDDEIQEIDIEATAEYRQIDFDISGFGQEEVEVIEDIIIDRPEIMPEFPGGAAAMYDFLRRRIVYPRMAMEMNIQGTVFVSFVVEKDGSITQVQVMRGIGGGCDEEAVRVIQAMPNWIPGQMGTHPVRVRFSMPIVFRLSTR